MLNLELDGMPIKMETWCRRRHKTTFLNNEKNVISPLEEACMLTEEMKNDFHEETLQRHNEYRMRHGCQSLVISHVLNDYAQKWAQYLANTSHIHHSGQIVDGIKVGENIAVIYSEGTKEINGKEVSDEWYSEIKLYDFETGNGSDYTGHFTQMVWKETQQMGIGQTMSKDGRSIVVANYFPQGNVPGQYIFNVLPLNNHRNDISRKDDDGPKGKNIDLSSIKSALPEPPDNLAVPNCCPADYKNVEELVEKPFHTIKHFKPFPQTLETFVRECVESHNKYRTLHGSPPLKTCRSLTALAQEWAEKLTKGGQTPQHCNRLYKGQHLGENFMYKWCKDSGNLTGAQVADTWYGQVAKYDFSHTKHSMDTGHFTQMIWRSSNEIGIGKARNLNGAIVVVAFYHPAGNLDGAFSLNIHPPLKDKK